MKQMPDAGVTMGKLIRAVGVPQLWTTILCGALLLVTLAAAALPEEALIVPGTLPLDADGNSVRPPLIQAVTPMTFMSFSAPGLPIDTHGG